MNSNSSGYKGVTWDAKKEKWLAYISVNGKLKWLGYHTEKMEAAYMYNLAAKKHFGEFALLNELPSIYAP